MFKIINKQNKKEPENQTLFLWSGRRGCLDLLALNGSSVACLNGLIHTQASLRPLLAGRSNSK